MKSAALWLVGVSLTIAAALSVAAPNPDAALDLVQRTTEELKSRFDAIDRQRSDADPARRALVGELLTPHFDFERVCRLTLGKHWRQATEEQRSTVITALRGRLVNVYYTALNDTDEFQIGYLGARSVKNSNDAVVRTEVRRPGKPAIRVNYRLRPDAETWKAIDVVVGGVSLVITHRKEFYEHISKGGLDGLTRVLATEQKSK